MASQHWFAGVLADDPVAPTPSLVFAGLPDDSQSSFLRGARMAPQRLREAYDGRCYNATTELGKDLHRQVFDLGDWPSLPTATATFAEYSERTRALLRAGHVPFFCGGDHAVTPPVVQAFDVLAEPIHVVQIDAHPDLYEEYEGSRTSHACVAARILEMPHVAQLTQIGIRTMTATQRATAERHRERIQIYEARSIPAKWSLAWDAPTYLTIDLDGFDPAFAPGVSHPVPGGLAPREVFSLIHSFQRLVGMDVVELNPERDSHDLTAILAARLLHEGMGRCDP